MLSTVSVFRGQNKTNINKEEKGEDNKGYRRVYRVYSMTRVNMSKQDIQGYT